jgi:hypothetical protein
MTRPVAGEIVDGSWLQETAQTGAATLDRLRKQWESAGPPIIIFNKSHSGSRLLARLILASGTYLGVDRNESEDAVGVMDLVRQLVDRHYPNFAALLRDGDPELESLVNAVLTRHLRGHAAGQRWGWKLCETLYILPVLQRIFPTAHFVHLLRDGRDVAFSDHVAPQEAFWRKVYFDTAQITSWNGNPLTDRSYRRSPHIFNARHWVNSVTVARHFGSMLGENYLEVRFEDLVLTPRETAGRLFSLLGLAVNEAAIERFAASTDRERVGKFRKMPRRKRTQVEAVLRPTLEAFGYGLDEPPSRQRWFSWR